VQGLLDATLGPGQAVARVSAVLNFDQVERTEEKFDPQGVLKQKTKTTESNKGRTSAALTPVGAPDLGEPQNGANVTQNEGNRDSESVTYEVSRVVARTLTAPGELKRVSVAVMLNVPVKVTPPADKDAKDAKEVRTPVPRSAEEIEKIRKVVMGAVGFDEKRGDDVTVVEMPFDGTVAERERGALEQSAPVAGGPLAQPWVSYVLAGGAVVLVLAGLAVVVTVLRQPGRRPLVDVRLAEAPTGSAPVTSAAGVPALAAPSAPRTPHPLVPEELLELSREREEIRQKALTMATTEPDATAQLLRAWLVKKRQLPTGRSE
jgi:flagellar M-ring protein FliF